MARPTIRLRLARAILGRHAKDFIPPLSYFDRFGTFAGRLNDYRSKSEQLDANIGWCFAANNAIVEPTAAVKLKLYRKKKDGTREEIFEHELLELFEDPNRAHTGEQLRNLHFTYMNFVGESYTYLRDDRANEFVPARGKLPAALENFPAHLVQFKLGESYSQSTVKYGNNDYRLQSVVRDLNPDPGQPYHGRSIIRAAALTIDTENQMKEWNRGVFANSARPSLIFSTNEPLDEDSYARWEKQFRDEHTGTENAYKAAADRGRRRQAVLAEPAGPRLPGQPQVQHD
jgi:phage portal protein BeeE